MRVPNHDFGGDWTTEKLERVRKYLVAYARIFEVNRWARRFTSIYVDAFAGTGYRSVRAPGSEGHPSFAEFADPDAEAFLKGSARIALEVEPPFNRYLFVERDPDRARELEKLRQEFPDKADRVQVVQEEANAYLMDWCRHSDWGRSRAVMFLDPYGMEVEWALIETIAQTRAIDLWLLFPLGVAVNRLLTRAELPPPTWSDALTRLFGSDDWRDAFYHQRTEVTLFGEKETQVKDADFESIAAHFVKRLRGVFAGVADNPLPLRNSRNVPIYLLCFAAGNERAVPTAIKIAQDILRR